MNKLFSVENYSTKDNILGLGILKKREGLDVPVRLGIDLTEAYMQKQHSKELDVAGVKFELSEQQNNYKAFNEAFQVALFRYVFNSDKLEFADLKQMLTGNKPLNTNERERYYEVITSVETVVVPAVTSAMTGMYNEVRNIALGDTAEFDVESNEILIANVSAEGVPFGGEQHLYRDTKVITTKNLNISFSTPWYQVATGKADFGQLFYKASLGFANYFAVEAYNQLVTMAASLPAYCRYTGFTTENIDLATMATSGANGGAKSSIIGTLPALREILPTNDFLKQGIGEEWVKVGYIGTHAGSPVVLLDNLINPTTINSNSSAGTPSFMFATDELFVLPFINRRPVKTVFEGDVFTVNESSIQTADKTERATINYKVGIGFVLDQLFGYITKS